MKRGTFTMNSHDGKTKLHGVTWEPEGEARAVVQIVHGMIEYIERYDGFASYLAERGYFVIGHDHLGHGESAASQDDWGFFEEENGNRVLLEDIHQVRRRAQERYPDAPYILLGHSMGSFLVRQYLCIKGEGICEAVILGTGNMPASLLRFGMFVTSTMAAVDTYRSEPKTSFDFTLNGYYNLFYSMLWLKKEEHLRRMRKDLPVLFASGTADPVGSYGKGVEAAAESFRAHGVTHVDVKLYPADRHEILNELDRQQVYEDLWRWMEENRIP